VRATNEFQTKEVTPRLPSGFFGLNAKPQRVFHALETGPR